MHGDARRRAWRSIVGAAIAIVVGVTMSVGVSAGRPEPPPSAALPIVFVHGQSGSAQQFETQAMRFTSNGYPQGLLYAFEYDTSSPVNPLADLDAFIDGVLADTGAEQVYAIGHSRGTTVWTGYLGDPSYGGAKVAKYVNIDGRTQPDLPGGVPTIGIWGEWNTAGSGYNRRGDTNAQIGPDPADNFHYADKSHTETATSAEAFAVMFEFLTGTPASTTDVVPEPPGRVSVAGRATIFPENVGADGAMLEVWRVHPATGARVDDGLVASVEIGGTGEFGPIAVNGLQHYEFALIRSDGSVHHFYPEPFSRTDHFLRLNTSRPNQGLEVFIPRSAASTNLVIVRQREFWGDQGDGSDRLLVDGLDLLTPVISPRIGVNLAVFGFDAGLDGVTDLDAGVPFPFGFLAFLTAADVAIAAAPDSSGVVSVTDVSRGSGNGTTVNVPNWPSDVHRITVQFRDDDQAIERFTDLRGRG